MTCKGCKHYVMTYGIRDTRPEPTMHTGCMFNKAIAKDCKENNYKLKELKK